MHLKRLNQALLMVSSAILTVIALTFGADPVSLVPTLYHTPVADINAIHIYRSVMGLILGVVAFWLYAAFNSQFTLAALYSLGLAMLGLSLSRIFSLLVDTGEPTTLLLVYLLAELGTALVVFLLIRQNRKHASTG